MSLVDRVSRLSIERFADHSHMEVCQAILADAEPIRESFARANSPVSFEELRKVAWFATQERASRVDGLALRCHPAQGLE